MTEKETDTHVESVRMGVRLVVGVGVGLVVEQLPKHPFCI